MNLIEHFPKDRTAHYVWQLLLQCQRNIRDGGRMSAGQWQPLKTKKAVEIERAKCKLLAKILANSSKVQPIADFYFLMESDKQVNG